MRKYLLVLFLCLFGVPPSPVHGVGGLNYPGGLTTISPAGCVQWDPVPNPATFKSTGVPCGTTNAVQVRHCADLGTPANGGIFYCDDCFQTDPCTCGGAGAFAEGINGAWVCTSGAGARQFGVGFVSTSDLFGFTNRTVVVNKVHNASLTKVCCYADVAGVVITTRSVAPGLAPVALPTPAVCATPGYTGADAGCITGLTGVTVPINAEIQLTLPGVGVANEGNKSLRVVYPFTN